MIWKYKEKMEFVQLCGRSVANCNIIGNVIFERTYNILLNQLRTCDLINIMRIFLYNFFIKRQRET
jgi:hypothetical protein